MDVHLMIEDPGAYVPGFADAGADIITIHVEAAVHPHRGSIRSKTSAAARGSC
jgi:ribulose-phosphate 3-epimerase